MFSVGPEGEQGGVRVSWFLLPWIDFLKDLEFEPLLANPLKVKLAAEDINNDKVDSKTLVN